MDFIIVGSAVVVGLILLAGAIALSIKDIEAL